MNLISITTIHWQYYAGGFQNPMAHHLLEVCCSLGLRVLSCGLLSLVYLFKEMRVWNARMIRLILAVPGGQKSNDPTVNVNYRL